MADDTMNGISRGEPRGEPERNVSKGKAPAKKTSTVLDTPSNTTSNTNNDLNNNIIMECLKNIQQSQTTLINRIEATENCSYEYDSGDYFDNEEIDNFDEAGRLVNEV